MISISILLLSFAVFAESPHGLVVKEAFARATPPGLTSSAAYLTVINNSKEDFVIIGANCPMAMAAELHEDIKNSDGSASMKHLRQVRVPAHGKVSFAPMGKHIMIMGLKQALVKGKELKLSLLLSNHQQIPVVAKIH